MKVHVKLVTSLYHPDCRDGFLEFSGEYRTGAVLTKRALARGGEGLFLVDLASKVVMRVLEEPAKEKGK